MRTRCAVIILFVLVGSGYCQSPNASDTEAAVRRFMASGLMEGSTDKLLSRSGDASAVALTKILAGKQLNDADIRKGVDMIDASFAAPRIVEVSQDRQPRCALFVLRYFEYLATDKNLKKRIESTEKRLWEEYSQSTHN